MDKATRKQVRQALEAVGVYDRFTLRTVSFSDLARCERQFVEFPEWEVEPGKSDRVREALKPLGVIPQFPMIFVRAGD